MTYTRHFIPTLLILFTVGVSAADQAPPVTTARPLVKQLQDWDEYTGRFLAEERVDIRSRVSGYISEVRFREGQMVEAGAVLFVIDQRPFELAVADAEAALAQARARYEVAQSEFMRGEKLLRTNAMSREEVDIRRGARDSGNAEIEAARAALGRARLELEYTEIKSPISGRVSYRRLDVGNLVNANDSTQVLTTVVSTDPVELMFEVSESEYLRYVRLRQSGKRFASRTSPNPVYARLLDEQGWPHEGVMSFVDNEFDAETGTVRGKATFPNPDNVLLPGAFARIRVIGSSSYDAMLIPDEAIVSDQARKIVFVVDETGKVSPRPVKLGAMHEELRIIRDGLSAGDEVIIKGVQRASPGSQVQPTRVDLADYERSYAR